MYSSALPPHPCRVLILHDMSTRYIKQLRQRFSEVDFIECCDSENVDGAIANANAQVVLSLKSDAIPGVQQRKAIASPHLKWLHVAGTGFEHLLPITRDDLIVTNSAGVLSDFMAESVLGSMLGMNFGLHRYIEQQRQHEWREIPWSGLRGKTALIVGLGSIGRRVAKHARAFGMHVIGLRARSGTVDEVDEIVAGEDLLSALARSDVLCVHVPLLDATRNLIDARAFEHMRKGMLIVNTSRGGVMDESALVKALQNGTVAAAHLDVFETEPLPKDSHLWDTPNLVITPHMSDTVADFETRYAEFFADNLQRWLNNEALLNVVDTQRGY